jgi:nucleoid-associated protein YgaU
VPIPIPHEDSWQNGGYAVQWWLFAGMVYVLFGWQARREVLETPGTGSPRPAKRAERSRDRVADADARRSGMDRVAEADRRASEAAASRPVSSATATAERGDGGDRPVATQRDDD